MAQFQSTDQEIADSWFSTINSARSSLNQIKTASVTFATNTINEMVKDDNPQPSNTLQSSITEVIDQMIGAGDTASPDDSVDHSAVSASVAAGATPANTGTGAVVASVKRPDGLDHQFIYPEDVTVTIATDVCSNAVARSETANFQGEATLGSKLAYDWPKGSGANPIVTGKLSHPQDK